MAKKLSADEREILLWLMEYHQAIERHGSDTQRQEARTWGVPWDGTIGYGPAKAVAVVTLRRLRERGLIQPREDPSWDAPPPKGAGDEGWPEPRFINIRLTDAGRSAATDLQRHHR